MTYDQRPGPPPRSGWLSDAAVGLLLTAAVAAVYGPVLNHDFVSYDDAVYVTENARVLGGLTAEGIRWAFTSGHGGNWHPVTWLSHMLDVQLFGADPGMHHLTSVLVHAVNVLLVYGVFCLLTGDRRKSGLVAALFAVHPINVESVAWVAQRKTLVCCLFWMLTLRAYLGYAAKPGPRRYALVAGCIVFALMAKPMAVTLPFVLLLLDYWPLDRLGGPGSRWPALRKRVLEKAPLFALSAAACLITLTVQQRAGAVGSMDVFPPAARAANAVVAYGAYVQQAVWPSGLAFLYPFPAGISPWRTAAVGLALTLVTVSVVRSARPHPFLLFGWLWYAGTLVPVIGLVQVGLHRMADRYAYLPLIGLWVMAAWGGGTLARRTCVRWPVAWAAVAVVIGSLAMAARMQVDDWKNSTTLYVRALEVTSDNYVAHTNLGNVYRGRGDLDRAVAEYREALRIRPDFPKTHNNLGVALEEQGRSDAAERHYRLAIALDPKSAQAHYNLGLLLEKTGDKAAAGDHFGRAAALDPGLAAAHFRLGNMKAESGRNADAAVHYRAAIEADPGRVEAHLHLGNVLLALGQVEEAIQRYLAALRIDPDDARVHNNLGIAWVRRGNLDNGIDHFHRALRLQPMDGETRDNLKRALSLKAKAVVPGSPPGR